MSEPNEPAFPGVATQLLINPDNSITEVGSKGLTKRELFAAMAMQGFCLKSTGSFTEGPCNSALIKRSVFLADALIKELKNPPSD